MGRLILHCAKAAVGWMERAGFSAVFLMHAMILIGESPNCVLSQLPLAREEVFSS
jgi:hypothetical protein